MKVLMLTVGTSLQDGINRHILTISTELARQGTQVAVCTVGPFGELAHELQKIGVRTYALGCRNGHDVRIVRRFAHVMCDFRPDVIHSHVLAMMVRIVLACRFKGVARVVTVHGTGCYLGLKGKFRKVCEQILSCIFPLRNFATCYVSDGVKEARLGDANGSRICTIPNPVACDIAFSGENLRRRLGLADDVPIVGTACRIASVKNPMAFLCAMNAALDEVPAAHAVVMGTGDAKLCHEIEEFARDCPRIHLLGYCPNARELLAQCDLFVMTSRTEGLPTAALEALAAGVPVAFWRGGGGLQDLARLNEEEGPIGLVCDQGDEAGLAHGIANVLAGKLAFPREKIAALVRRKYSVETVARDLIDVYRQAFEEGKR